MKTSQRNISTDKIHQESYWAYVSTIILCIAVISGVILTFFTEHFSYWVQINTLGHTIASTLSFIPLSVYIVVHFKRTVGIRNAALIFTGILLCLLLLLVYGSGAWLALQGHSESLNWVSLNHATAAYITIAFIVLHLCIHITNKAKKQKSTLFITLSTGIVKQAIITLIIYSAIVSILVVIYQLSNDSEYTYSSDESNPQNNYSYDYGSHIFRPSQTETSSGNFITTQQIAKSHQCGSCHKDIYQQWLSSTHRQAASDPAYVKNITLLEKTRGISATRYCEGCHAPVALLTGELTPGGKHGGIQGTPAHLEGVGCMGCHGINKVVHLNGTASYEFSPKEHYLFDSGTGFASQKIRNFLIRLQPEKHKAAMGSELMQEPKLCASCHEQFMDKSMNDWGWVKMQSEYHDWLASPFSGQKEQNFQTNSVLTCQNCHFPLVAGIDPSADSNGMIHSHRSLGANTVLPFLNGDIAQLEATVRFLQSAKVLIDIEEPHRQDNVQNHQFIDQKIRPQNNDNTPFFLYLGETAQLNVAVINRMVGHSFPAGTTDINQAWISFTVVDAENEIIFESGQLNENKELDSTAHIYHSIPVDRQGKHIWKHDLFRMTGNAYKNVIPPGKSDIKEYIFSVPSWAKTPLTVTAIVKYRKFNQRYARWALNHPKPVLPIVDMARDTLMIPLKIKPVIQ